MNHFMSGNRPFYADFLLIVKILLIFITEHIFVFNFVNSYF